MLQKKKINWWVIAAIIIIGVPVGYAGTAVVVRIFIDSGGSVPGDTISYLSLSSDSLSFGSDGGSDSFNVKSNVGWQVEVTGGVGWLTATPESGNDKGDVTLTVVVNEATEKREATVTVNWQDDKGRTSSRKVNVTQGGAKPSVKHVTAEELQPVVSIGGSSDLIASGCMVVVNSTTSLTYNKFSTECQNGTYKDVKVTKVDIDSNTGNVRAISVRATVKVPVKHITKAEAQRIVAAGDANEKIPDNCLVEVNDAKMDYGVFRKKVKDGDYPNVIVTNLTTNDEGAASRLKVTTKVKPVPVTAEELQPVVSIGGSSDRIASGCKVVVNGTTTLTYNKFSTECQKGTYKDVQVTKVNTDSSTGNAKAIRVRATIKEPVKPITKAEAQRIVAAGDANEKIPDNCLVEVNEAKMNYGVFRQKVKDGDYANVIVIDLTTNDEDAANRLKVTAKMKPVPITKEEVQRAIGKSNERIPRTCKVVVNESETIAYWNFCRGMDLGNYTNVVVNNVTTDSSGNATHIRVSASVAVEE